MSSSVAKNISYNLGGTILTKLSAPILSILIARELSPEIYGTFFIAMAIISALDFVRDLGMTDSIIVARESELENLVNIQLTFQFFLSIILYLLIFLCSSIIADFYESTELSLALKIMGITVIIKAISDPLITYNLKKQNYKLLFFRQLIPSLFRGLFALLLAKIGLGLQALVWSYLFSELLVSIFYIFRTDHKLNLSYNVQLLKQNFEVGKHIILQKFLTTFVLSKVDVFFIGYFKSSATIGVYNMSKNLMLLLPRTLIAETSRVMYTDLSQTGKNRKWKKYYTNFAFLFGLIIFSCSVIAYYSLDLIVPLVLGEKWVETISYLKLFSVLLILTPMMNMQMIYFKLNRKLREASKILLVYALIMPVYLWGFHDYHILEIVKIYVAIDIFFKIIITIRYLREVDRSERSILNHSFFLLSVIIWFVFLNSNI